MDDRGREGVNDERVERLAEEFEKDKKKITW